MCPQTYYRNYPQTEISEVIDSVTGLLLKIEILAGGEMSLFLFYKSGEMFRAGGRNMGGFIK